jgi:hypothetical protein
VGGQVARRDAGSVQLVADLPGDSKDLEAEKERTCRQHGNSPLRGSILGTDCVSLTKSVSTLDEFTEGIREDRARASQGNQETQLSVE